MKFFSTLKQSFTHLEAYSQFAKQPLSFSFFFIFKFYFLFFLAGAVTFPYLAGKETQRIVNSLPDSFVASYKDGTMQTTGIALPYEIHLPQETKLIFTNHQIETHLANTQPQIITYKDIVTDNTQFSLTKNDLKQQAKTFIQITTVLFTLSLIIVLLISRFVWLALYALFFSSLGKMFGKYTPYRITFHLGMHVMVVAEIINTLYLIIYRSLAFPMFDVAFLVIMLLVLRTLPRRSGQIA